MSRRGPNKPRAHDPDNPPPAWIGCDNQRPLIVDAIGRELSDGEWLRIKEILVEYKHGVSLAEAPTKAVYDKARERAIGKLERATIDVGEAIDDLPEVEDQLGTIHNSLANLLVHAKQCEPLPGTEVSSDANVKEIACEALCELAKEHGWDAKALVRACEIHVPLNVADEDDAFDRWFRRASR